MKKTVLIIGLLLATFSWGKDHTFSKEEIELEREKLQLQRELIDLERQKLELERLKLEMNQAASPTIIAPVRRRTYTKDLYVGIDYLVPSKGERKRTLNGTEDKDISTSHGYGIKLGFGSFDENRVELTYSRVTLALEDEETDWDVAMVSLDYLFVYHEAFAKDLSPLIKVGLVSASSGEMGSTLRAMGYSVSGEQKITGFGVRLGVGICYLLDEKMELALGIDSAGIFWDDTTLTHSGGSDKLELDDSIGMGYLNFAYRF